jgi:hypothetical protein
LMKEPIGIERHASLRHSSLAAAAPLQMTDHPLWIFLLRTRE